MIPRPARRPATPARAIALASVLLTAAVLATACGTPGPTASPIDVPSPTTAPSAEPTDPPLTPVPGDTAPPSTEPGEVGQTDTEWGRIWDALPPSFPRIPGAIPTDPIEGPASGAFAIGASAEEATSEMQAALELANYSTFTLSGPFEDGSHVIESIGATEDCRVETRVTPLSGTTHITVRLAAACPFE